MISLLLWHLLQIQCLLKFLQNWDHQSVDDIVGASTTGLDESSHWHIWCLSKVDSWPSEVLSWCVFDEDVHCHTQEWCQSILTLLRRHWFTRNSKPFQCCTTLVTDSGLVSDGLHNAVHELWDDLLISEDIRMMFTNSSHNPCNGFSDLAALVLEHLKQVL